MSEHSSYVEDILDRALEKHGSAVVPLLQEIQEHFGYLPEEKLVRTFPEVRDSLNRHLSCCNFYNSLHLTPEPGIRSASVPALPATSAAAAN